MASAWLPLQCISLAYGLGKKRLDDCGMFPSSPADLEKQICTYALGSEISCRAVPIVITSTSLLLTNCTVLVIVSVHVNTYDLATIYHRVNRINEYYLSKSTYHMYKLGVDMIHVHHILLFPREELSITACFSRRARVP